MRERQDVEERSSQTHSTWQHEERTRWGSQATLTATRSQLIGQGGSQHVLSYRGRRRWATAFSATEKTKKNPGRASQSRRESGDWRRLRLSQPAPAASQQRDAPQRSPPLWEEMVAAVQQVHWSSERKRVAAIYEAFSLLTTCAEAAADLLMSHCHRWVLGTKLRPRKI